MIVGGVVRETSINLFRNLYFCVGIFTAYVSDGTGLLKRVFVRLSKLDIYKTGLNVLSITILDICKTSLKYVEREGSMKISEVKRCIR